ncbi:hypothetical protein R0J89_17995, partial [Psychrobacter sp. SIMBA_152]
MPNSAGVNAVGMEEQAEIGYRLMDSGEFQFFALRDKAAAERKAGDIISWEQVADSDKITSFA